MKTVTVRELSHEGVSKAIRTAQVEPVLVSKNNEPAVWMVSADALAQVVAQRTGDQDIYWSALQVVAADLFDRDVLSMGRAAQLAGLSLSDFIDLCDRLRVPVLRDSEIGVAGEVDTFETWLEGVEVTAEEVAVDRRHADNDANR